LDPTESKKQEDGENSVTRNFINCTLHQILFGRWSQGRWDVWGTYNAWDRWEIYTKYCISHLSHPYYMSRPSQPSWLDHPNNIWWSVQVMKLLIMRSSASCHFPPLRSKYSRQYPVVSLCPSLSVRDQLSHPYKATDKIMVLYKRVRQKHLTVSEI